MDRNAYTVTDLAGTHVAGRRIEDRKAPLLLTEEEARMETLAGTIRPTELPLPPFSADETVGEATGKELVGIPGAPAGTVGEAFLGSPDEPDAPVALPADRAEDAPATDPAPARRSKRR